MQAVAAFFASIITFVSGFFAPTLASNTPVDIRTTQPAAAAAAQTEITGDPFNDPAAASAVAAASAAAPTPATRPQPTQTIINQPVIERIIERIAPQGAATVSTQTLAAILADFEQSISSRIAALNPPKAVIPEQVAAAGNATGAFFPASQRIDQITNTAINTPTISGGTISGASVSGYLPLSGGTLTGGLSGTDLNLSGVLTAGTLNVGGLSSSGALFAPYFSATSTTATSTLAGGLAAANGSFSILQNGNVGIGTAAPSIAGANSNSRVLSIVGDGTLVNARGVLELANPRASGSLAANDTAGSAFFVMSNNSGNPYIAGILGSLSGSGGANGFGGKLQFQTKADNNASSATTKMVLDQNGNVGIGTTTPGALLSVNGNILGNGTLALTGTTGTSTIAAGQGFAIGGSQFVVQQGSGNVGIGTASPLSLLQIKQGTNQEVQIGGTAGSYANSTYFTDLFRLNSAINFSRSTDGAFLNSIFSYETAGLAESNLGLTARQDIKFVVGATADRGMVIKSSGNVGIGTTSPWGKLSIKGSGTGTGLAFTVADSVNTPRFVIQDNGNVGIGTTTPTAQLHTTGTIRFSNFGAGTLTTDASGNLSVSSDERLKNVDGQFSRGLADIMKLNPIIYHWNGTSGLDTSTQYAGFSAQNVQAVIPEAVGSSTSGYLSLQDRPLIAAVVNAIKELSAKLDTLATQVSSFAEHFTTKELVFVRAEGDDLTLNHQLCIRDGAADPTPICLTKSQVAAVLAAAGQATISSSPVAPSGTRQAPVIELNGNASSTIKVGHTYNDLGARIVAPDSDLNLGIVILLDGATTSAISIDTSTPGEHTILYTVTSPTTGLTGSTIRTVIVAPAEQSQEPPTNDNPFNAPATPNPANDNASSTYLLNTEPAAVSL